LGLPNKLSVQDKKQNCVMPLRDQFRPPVENLLPWEGFHAPWPVMIVAGKKWLLQTRAYPLAIG
jgi:hypothetical protein